MLLSKQQTYILDTLKQFKYLRVRQLYALVQAHYRAQGIEISEKRMDIMLRQMRTGTNYVWLRGDVVSYGDRKADPRHLEALDVMLELTKAQPGFFPETAFVSRFSCVLPEMVRAQGIFSAWHGWMPPPMLPPSAA